jgi:hypothetical protein
MIWACLIQPRFTFACCAHMGGWLKQDLGTMTLSSAECGAGLDTVPLSKSEFARDSKCKEFYSNVHLDV